MHRSSESVAALAAALAKAQGELVNPEKSLIATVQSEGRGEASKSFRYAPLASGLDIVRKTLGRYEIATVQTTAVDQATGTIKLTTVLAHASGEWIASDWPVCTLADVATPHRMGAALTYARRYSLFTLVGIAGEDDLDAPDLSQTTTSPDAIHLGQSPQRIGAGYSAKQGRSRVTLDAEASSALRDRLIGELSTLASHESAAIWAKQILSTKNTLLAPDAELLEKAFQEQITALGGGPRPAGEQLAAFMSESGPRNVSGPAIDKSVLVYGAPRRHRNKEHLKFISTQPCVICGRKPSDAHHLRFAQARALGRKVSDEFTVPLCRAHHRELHRSGDERGWWTSAKLEPLEIARKFWKRTRSRSETAHREGENGKTKPKTTLQNNDLSERPALEHEPIATIVGRTKELKTQ